MIIKTEEDHRIIMAKKYYEIKPGEVLILSSLKTKKKNVNKIVTCPMDGDHFNNFGGQKKYRGNEKFGCQKNFQNFGNFLNNENFENCTTLVLREIPVQFYDLEFDLILRAKNGIKKVERFAEDLEVYQKIRHSNGHKSARYFKAVLQLNSYQDALDISKQKCLYIQEFKIPIELKLQTSEKIGQNLLKNMNQDYSDFNNNLSPYQKDSKMRHNSRCNMPTSTTIDDFGAKIDYKQSFYQEPINSEKYEKIIPKQRFSDLTSDMFQEFQDPKTHRSFQMNYNKNFDLNYHQNQNFSGIMNFENSSSKFFSQNKSSPFMNARNINYRNHQNQAVTPQNIKEEKTLHKVLEVSQKNFHTLENICFNFCQNSIRQIPCEIFENDEFHNLSRCF